MLRGLTILACVLTIVITASSAFIRHSMTLAGCAPGQACGQMQVSPASQPATIPAVPGTAAGTNAAGTTGTDAAGRAPAASSAASLAASVAAPPPGVAVARTLHRFSASAVGLLVLWILFAGWKKVGSATRLVALFALMDTVFLAWLGRHTPGGLPLVTLGNLLGGIALAAAFGWIAMALGPVVTPATAPAAGPGSPKLGLPVVLALLLFGVAAWLGTMIQAHEAISACRTLNCPGGARYLWPALDPAILPASVDPFVARGLHWLHRIAAAAFAAAVLVVAVRARGVLPAASLVVLLVLQVASGARATVAAAPLLPATAHNVFANLLMIALVVVAAAAATRSDRFARAVRQFPG